jgi:hypothetical protein
MPNLHKNPFENAENLTPIFESSQRYQDHKKQALNTFLQTQSFSKPIIQNPSILTTIFTMTQSLTHISRLGFAALALFTIIGGGLTAQAFAPENLKPVTLASGLFSANRQKDLDPKIALVADNENQILEVKDCGLDVKIAKKVQSNTITVDEYKSKTSYSKEFGISKTNTIMGQRAAKENFIFAISCEKIDQAEFFKIGNLAYYTAVTNKTKYLTKADISKDILIQKTGWFVGDDDISNIFQYEINPNESQFYNVGYIFQLNNTRYKVESISNKDQTNLEFIDFQLQFKK